MTNAKSLRYVVLRHEGVAEPHYDLMWESQPGSQLATVRCTEWLARGSTTFEPLPDHRSLYLDYEGPVSGGRGYVRRVAAE